jgi:sec-independent protein translocase protein TatA
MFDIGIPELVVILVVSLLIFGPGKMIEIGRDLGKGLRDFRKATSDVTKEFNEAFKLDEPEKPAPVVVPEPVAAPVDSTQPDAPAFEMETALAEETGPVESTPLESASVEAALTEPAPTESAPVEPESIELAPTESAPVEPESIELAPTESAPMESEPVEPESTEPTPMESGPVDPASTEPAPVEFGLHSDAVEPPGSGVVARETGAS